MGTFLFRILLMASTFLLILPSQQGLTDVFENRPAVYGRSAQESESNRWVHLAASTQEVALENANPADLMGPPEPVMSFQEWKDRQVRAAQINLANERSRNKEVRNQAQTNLEVAKELSINDYFVVYLVKHAHPNAFLEAAKKMTPQEMAELMESYRRYRDQNKPGAEDSSSPSFVGSL